MNFIKKNYWLACVLYSLLVGTLVFFVSYQVAKNNVLKETSHKVEVVTNVKWQILNRKLESLEQQLIVLSKNKELSKVLSSLSEENHMASPNALFDEYVKSILYNQGCNDILITDESTVLYSSKSPRDKKTIPPEIYSYTSSGSDPQHSSPSYRVVLPKSELQFFYLCMAISNAQGTFRGTLSLEVPKEFLSIELHNTISLDSLSSYLISHQGTLNQHGKILSDTCRTCRMMDDSFLSFSPDKKIKDMWALISSFPTSEIEIQMLLYTSLLDGMIAFFASCILAMIIIYSVQMIQKSKGITNADVLLVQTTWNAVSEFSINIIGGFYKHLFALAPEVKPMFKSERSEQEKRMALMINTIVNSVDSLEEFKASIAQLAKRHTHMGVKREYFPVVVKAIISSVEDQYGNGFTAAHRKAWYKILNRISAIMIEEMEAYQRTLRNTVPAEEGK